MSPQPGAAPSVSRRRCATRCVAAPVAIMLQEGGRKVPLNQCYGGVAAPWRGPVKRELVRSGRLRPLFDTAKMERDRVKAMGTNDDGGNGGLHNSLGALLVGRRSDAANTVARGTRHPSLASHTDISDCHITVVSWSMVGGLEVGLALRLRRLLSVAGLVASRKADLGPAKGTTCRLRTSF
jgi:hypothetical protein